MSSIKYIAILLLSILVLGGCVSKKKYLEMVDSKEKFEAEASKMKAENNSLRDDLKTSETDFKSMKDYLYASDAAKNDQLETLQKELNEVEASYNLIKKDLSKTQNLFKDQRYFNAKASSEISRLEIEIKQLARDTASINYSLKLARKRINEYKKRAEDRTAQVNDKNLEISDLNATIKTKDSELETLQANVETEKKKMEEIDKAFIALRRQLVSAKAKGETIDPNSNANINKISKALGQY